MARAEHHPPAPRCSRGSGHCRGFDARTGALGALPFVFAQRRQFHLGLARIGAMNGLAVVAKGFLREPFGITGGLCPFRPCVAVAVQRHAFDANLPSPLSVSPCTKTLSVVTIAFITVVSISAAATGVMTGACALSPSSRTN